MVSDPQDVDGYTYSTLPDQRSIRLITSLATNGESGALQCHLDGLQLDSRPAFTALSYTWASSESAGGDPDRGDGLGCGESRRTIECRTTVVREESEEDVVVAGSVAIPETLFDALSQFVKKGIKGPIWIDAICINQADLAERAQQVSLMGDIYSSAICVFIWLGKDTTGLEDFLWLHHTLLPRLLSRQVRAKDASNPAFVSSLGVESMAKWEEVWSSYPLFFSRRRWFYRVWIVQELALAQLVGVFCGDVLMPWKEMLQMAKFLSESGWRHHLSIPTKPDKRPLGQELERLGSLRFLCQEEGPDGQLQRRLESYFGVTSQEQRWYAFLAYLISRLRRSKATDPRDMIYGILGLALRFLPKGIANPVNFSYSKSVADVYTDIFTLLLKNLPRLFCLCFVEHDSRPRLPGLPSWVPDLTYPFAPKPFAALGRPSDSDDNIEQDFSLMGDLFDASLCRITPAPLPNIEGGFLSLLGARFDVVAETSVPLENSDAKYKSQFDMCLSLDGVYAPTGQVREEVLWRTSIADFHGTYPAPKSLSWSFHQHLCHSISLMLSGVGVSRSSVTQVSHILHSLNRLHYSSPQSPRNILPSVEEIVKYADAWRTLHDPSTAPDVMSQVRQTLLTLRDDRMAFERAAGEIYHDRKLYRTTRGYLGIGPVSVRPGDEVWVLRGGRVPFLLRPSELLGAPLSLVGEAYLHGFMHGEMLTEDVRGRIGPVVLT